MSKSINDLSLSLADFADDFTDEIKDIIRQESKNLINNIRQDSPVDAGNYKKEWKLKKKFENASSISFNITNKKMGSLVFLLEKGHALSAGGRTKAVPHIFDNHDNAKKRISERIEKIFEN